MAAIATRRRSSPLVSRGERGRNGAGALHELADADLLSLVSQRGLPALAAIYDRHGEAAWTVAVAYADDVAAAEKAVAAAFLHVWREPEAGGRASLGARLLARVKREALSA